MRIYDILFKMLTKIDLLYKSGRSKLRPQVKYSKYSSGKVVYEVKLEAKILFNKQSGNLFYSDLTIDIPSDITQPIELKTAHGHFDYGNGLCGLVCSRMSATSAKFYCWCATRETSGLDKKGVIYIEGRWK